MSHEETFQKVSEYIDAEVKASHKDYEFITKLNETTTESFKDFMIVAEKISKNVYRINENQKAKFRLENLVKSIDEIDARVSSLESLAYKIDSYSKRLEDTFKKLNPSSTQL